MDASTNVGFVRIAILGLLRQKKTSLCSRSAEQILVSRLEKVCSMVYIELYQYLWLPELPGNLLSCHHQ